MAYKAVVTEVNSAYSLTTLGYTAYIIDTSSNTVIDNIFGTLNYGSDISSYTLSEVQSGIQTQLIGLSYALSGSDILFIATNLLTPIEVIAIKSATQVRSFSTASRSLNSAFQVSSTRDALVNYSIDVASTLSLLAGQVGTVFLEYADQSGFTTGVTEVCRFVNGNSGTLTIGLNLTQAVTGSVGGMIPAGKYVRIRTANTTGTPTFTYRSGQEVLV